MMKKNILIVVLIIAALVISFFVIPLGWYYWQLNRPSLGPDDLSNQSVSKLLYYHNNRYGYSVEFIDNWWVGYIGDSKETANVVWFVSDSRDLEAADGGVPLGAKVEIFIQDLNKLKEVDSEFPDINSIHDWISWQDNNQENVDYEIMGATQRSEVTVADQEAVISAYENSEYVKGGKYRNVQLLNPNKSFVFIIQYTGREPSYTENLDKFQKIYHSFSFIDEQ